MTQERFDRWFNHTVACLLNVILTGLIIISYSAA